MMGYDFKDHSPLFCVRYNLFMSYRLLFLDLDGTLVGVHDTVSPRNLKALADANAAGCTVVICTARTRYMVRHIAEQWTGHGYGVFTNGAVIMEWETGLVLRKTPVPQPAMRSTIELARQAGLAILLFGTRVDIDGGQAVLAEEGASLHGAWEAMHGHRIVRSPDLLAEFSGMEPEARWHATAEEQSGLPPSPFHGEGRGEVSGLEPLTMGVYGDREPVEAFAASLRSTLATAVDVFCAADPKYDGWCCYLNSSKANKAAGAAHVAHMLNVPREQIMAIGDHMNDVEMLRWAGLGVAMGDGHVDAHSAADHVTAAQEADGVAEAIERFVLGRF